MKTENTERKVREPVCPPGTLCAYCCEPILRGDTYDWAKQHDGSVLFIHSRHLPGQGGNRDEKY